MKKKITAATKRTVPRPFKFDWGKGQVVEEASVKVKLNEHSWEPTIQLLRFDDGSETLRFCVFHGKQFSRMPLITSSDELNSLMKEAGRNPRMSEILKRSITEK